MNRLESLKALNAERTPGPWTVDDYANELDVYAPEHAVAHLAGPWTMGTDAEPAVKARALADAGLIAAAANAMEDLLAVVEAAAAVQSLEFAAGTEAWLAAHRQLSAALSPLLAEEAP